MSCCGKVSQKFRFKNKINKYKPNIGKALNRNRAKPML